MRRDQGGFTIPELIIMMVVTAILTTLVLAFAINFWSSTATLEKDSGTLVTRLNIGDALRDAFNVAAGLINQNSIGDSYTLNPDSTSGPAYWTMLHAIPGTTAMPAKGMTAPVLYFNAPSVDTSRNFIMNGSKPYQDEFVLYMNGTTKQLMLRTLINSMATGDRLKTSCPPANATTNCPADRILGEDIASVGMRYFSRSGNTIDYTSITDPLNGNYLGPDYPSVEVVEVTVQTFHKSQIHNGTDTSNKTIVRVAFRNG